MAIEIIKDEDIEYRVDDEKGYVMALWRNPDTNATYMAEAQCHSEDMQHYSRLFGMQLAEHRLMVQLGRTHLFCTLIPYQKQLKHLLQTCTQNQEKYHRETVLIERTLTRLNEQINFNKSFLKQQKQNERTMIANFAKRTGTSGQE